MSTVKADNFTWKTGEATAQSGVTVTGPQIVYGVAKSWCAYSGSSTAVRGSFNISSVTKNAGGDYSPNFNIAFYDINYSAEVSHGGGSFASTAILYSILSSNAAQAPTTSGFRFYVSVWNNSVAGIDGNYQNISVFR